MTPTLDDIAIGSRVRMARDKLRLTQAALAAKANVGEQLVRRLEIGTQIPSSEAIQRIADALNVPAWWLLYGDE